jgi:uncharacterized RDD family membrane protein YckC
MEKTTTSPELASGTKRFINYFFDFIFIKITSISILLIAGTLGILTSFQWFFKFLFMLNIGFLYYVVLESLYGQTLGKVATGTIVVTKDGKKPEFATILLRTICRFIPLEIFSFLGPSAIGWHDSLSKTRVIVKKTGEG